MSIKCQNTVNFSDIFEHASEKFDIGWNPCNDLFFHTILDYKGQNEFYLDELIGDLDCFEGDSRKSREIMISFMKENKVKTLLVIND